MGFPPEFLDEIRARVALADVIGRRVRLRKHGREHTGLCPFHNEKTPSFTVNEAKGFYHCFGCGAHGSVFDFVMHTEGASFPEAVERLAGEAGLEMPRRTREDRVAQDRRERLLACVEAAASWYCAQLAGSRGRVARDYLDRRGVTAAQVDRFRLGYAPDDRQMLRESLNARGFDDAIQVEAGLLIQPEEGGEPYDRFRHRLMFPIEDRGGRVIAFGGRALGETRAKYLNSPETMLFHKGAQLYNLPRARAAAHEKGRLIVVEGYMDVIGLDRAGIAEAVAPLGTALGEDQMRLSWRVDPEPILCFDGDAAGRRAAGRAAERALPLLAGGLSLRFALLPEGHDPDSLVAESGAAAMEGVLAGAVALVDLLWRQEAARKPLDTPERWADLRQRLQAITKEITDPALRRYYRDDFGERLAEARHSQSDSSRFAKRKNSYLVVGRTVQELKSALSNRVYDKEMLLLVMVSLNPAAVDYVWEDLAGMTFAYHEAEVIRANLISYFSLEGGERAPEQLVDILDSIRKTEHFQRFTAQTGQSRLPHIGYTQIEPWLEAWDEVIRNRFEYNRLQEDLAHASADYAKAVEQATLGGDSSSATRRRLAALHEAIVECRRSLAGDDGSDRVNLGKHLLNQALSRIEREKRWETKH